VIVDVTDKMKVVCEEIFGAVACVLPFDTDEEVRGGAE
jgi:acyl-CoA reductase-like NAD-dependent aldehyde dehydrogenase